LPHARRVIHVASEYSRAARKKSHQTGTNRRSKETEQSTITDSMIRKRVMAQFKSEQWSKHSLLNATVQGGTVKLWGIVDSEAEKEAARVAAKQVAGIQVIENNLIVQPVQA